jgi:replication factor C subunit 1
MSKHTFISWLGQNSKTTKYTKLLNEIQARMSRHSSADRFETREYYIPVLSARIFNALEEEDYDTAIQLMDEYELDRENIETISDLQLPSSLKTPLSKLPTSVKSTFTRK